MNQSQIIIEQWYKKLQAISEAISLEQGKYYTALEKKIQKEVVDPIWNRIVRAGDYTSKRNDRVYFDVDPSISNKNSEEGSSLEASYQLFGYDIITICTAIDFAHHLQHPEELEMKQENWKAEYLQNLFTDIWANYDELIALEELYAVRSIPDFKLTVSHKVIDFVQGTVTDINGRKMKLGKYITTVLDKDLNPKRNTILEPFYKKLKQAYAKYNTKRSQIDQALLSKEGKEYTIVISKHAYDVAGMSTGRGWRSCMKLSTPDDPKGGVNKSYVKCDVEEGSFIAYLVYKNDTNITRPVGRILIKPYYGALYQTLIYRLEQREYGTVSSFFKEEVENIIDKVQPVKGIPFDIYELAPSLYVDTDKSKAYKPPVPPILRTEEDKIRLFNLIKRNPVYLEHVPEELQTEEMCLMAVKQKGLALKYVINKTEEICLKAIEQNGNALEFVPEEFKTVELCFTAVERSGWALKYVPEKFQTKKLYFTAVEVFGLALQLVPEESKTIELCLIAVQSIGSALEFVPEKFQTKELCLEATKKDGSALRFIKNKTIQMHIIMIKLKKNPFNLGDIPEELQTEEIYLVAVKENGLALLHVPEKLRTEKICLAAIKQNGRALGFVPAELQTKETCLIAVKQSGLALKHVPEELQTKETCLMAVKQNGNALEYVPEKLQTPEIIQAALSQNPDARRYIKT
jgi:hypothetical protein